MKNFTHKIKLYITAHKVISAIVLIALLGAGYWGYKKITSSTGVTRYVSSKVTKGTLIVSISDSGQVSNVNQVNLMPKVSGDVVYVGVQNGQNVAEGQLILEVDPTTAQNAVNNAQASLDSAKLALKKIQIQNSGDNLNSSIGNSYSNGFSAVSSTFTDLQPTISGLSDILNIQILSDNSARNLGLAAQNYRNGAVGAYYDAKAAYDKNQSDFKVLSYNSSNTDIDAIITETYNTTELLANAIKNLNDYVNFVSGNSNKPSDFSSYLNTLSTYTNTTNSHISALLTAQTNIKNSKDSSQSSNLDIQSAQLNIQQQENALQQAKNTLAEYYLRAPFSGTITNFNVQKAASVSSSTSVGTLITKQQYAVISLNEVDVAKAQVGQKATLTFDAVPDLSIVGNVSEIDSIGTVSSGVVNYNVKINFATQDTRIKSGMSVNAAIITAIKQDALLVPNSAVKSSGGSSYVQAFNPPLPPPTDGLVGSISALPPTQIPVVVGLSNNLQTEIISGVNEGDEIITRIINPSTTTTAAPSILGNTGGGARGGGALRIGG